METLHFSININASKERVWDALWKDEYYREWTAAFTEGSYAVSDWKEGSNVHFLSPSGEGMNSVIEKLDRCKFMSFRFQGEIKDGVEVPPSPETEKWIGYHENYTLTENDGSVTLEVDLDTTEEYAGHFKEKFPVALAGVKAIAERNQSS